MTFIRTAYPAPQISGLCGGCNRQIQRGEIIVTSLIDTRHLGCASPEFMTITGCPHCMERHAVDGRTYDGSCLL